MVVVSARPYKRGCGTPSLEMVVLGEPPLLRKMHRLLIHGFRGELDRATRIGLLRVHCKVARALLWRTEV